MSAVREMPSVSVVLSVFDGVEATKATIDSVLLQAGIELELVIVSDGATQQVIKLIDNIDDQRVKIIKQDNAGLTCALIKGCQAASHEFIARIDAGDTMLAGRLKQQAQLLIENPLVGMVSCWVKMLTIEGYYLYDVCYSSKELAQGLAATDRAAFKSPLHTSMMFRKGLYQQAGGYRSEFYFTQDCDLWSRMLQYSKIATVEKFLNHAVFSADGISGRYADFQRQLVGLVAKANSLRLNGLSEAALLEQASALRPASGAKTVTAPQQYAGLYFIASVLSSGGSPYAAEYWQRALRVKPFSLIARFRWLASLRYANKIVSSEK